MSNALLAKARAILAHPRPGTSPMARAVDGRENKVLTIQPTVLTSITGGRISLGTNPSAPNLEIQPAAPDAKGVYWETDNGRILGPAVPEFLARTGSTFWISTTFNGQILWINADRLRSKKAFQQQTQTQKVDLEEGLR